MNRRSRALWIAVPVVVFGILAAQHRTEGDPVIDGWPLGDELDCGALVQCQDFLAVATAGLDRRNPGHAVVLRVALHNEGFVVDGLGYRHHATYSGACCFVARFELADGSVRAIGVGSVGVDPGLRAFDYYGP